VASKATRHNRLLAIRTKLKRRIAKESGSVALSKARLALIEDAMRGKIDPKKVRQYQDRMAAYEAHQRLLRSGG
jgi:hypothetical protein